MANTSFSGPLLQFGITLSSTSGDGLTGLDMEHNPQRAPMFADMGDAMMDPRSAYMFKPGHAALTYGFYNNAGVVDFSPSSASSTALVVNTASSGVSTFTLSAASSAAGTYSTTIIAPETGKVTGTLICLDSTGAYLTLPGGGASVGGTGTNPFVLWNPGAGAGRNITIFPSSTGDAGTYSVSGRDIYGYKMTETIAGGSTNLAGKKAFKYVSAITNTTTPVSTGITIGFGNVFGFPFAVPYVGVNATVFVTSSPFGSSAAVVPLSSVVVNLASTVATQTSTTPDVRGTYASSLAASGGGVRIQMIVTPAASAIATLTSTNFSPLFGATQFSSV